LLIAAPIPRVPPLTTATLAMDFFPFAFLLRDFAGCPPKDICRRNH
jgi:hypothetical protein